MADQNPHWTEIEPILRTHTGSHYGQSFLRMETQ